MPFTQSSQAFLGEFEAGLAQKHVGEQATAHADPAVDLPDGNIQIFFVQCLFPRQHMLVNAVDERAIEVEQEGSVGAGHSILR